MPTKRTRTPRHITPPISPDVLWELGDEILYPKPDEVNDWVLDLMPGYRNPECSFEECRVPWDLVKADLLEDWIEKFPGSRPRYWWFYEAPRLLQADLLKYGWEDHYEMPELCQERRKLGGSGKPLFETSAYKPNHEYGIFKIDPATVDPADPLRFESQASYLKRLGLLEPGEGQRLGPKDFEPEVITIEEV